MPLVVSCPLCETKLTLPEEFLGKQVKCAKCDGVFEAPTTAPASQDPSEGSERIREAPGDSSSPDRDFEKIPCPRCGERIYADADRCRFCGEDLDEFDDRRWEQRRGARRDSEPHRAPTIQALGIISIVCSVFVPCCGLIGVLFCIAGLSCGIPAWVMGHRDLNRMRLGEMDRRGRSGTQGGRTCGIVGVVLNILGVFAIIALYVGFFAFFAITKPSGPGGAPSPTRPSGPGRMSFVPPELRLHNYLPRLEAPVR